MPEDSNDQLEHSYESFAAWLYSLGAGQLSLTAVEVPIEVFVEAQQNGALANLELQIDDNGFPYLMAMIKSPPYQAVIVSVSFAPVIREERDEDEPDDGERG